MKKEECEITILWINREWKWSINIPEKLVDLIMIFGYKIRKLPFVNYKLNGINQ